MMKKILLFSALIAAFASCKEEDMPTGSSYPTDGLTLEKRSNALVLMGSSNQNPTTAAYEMVRLMVSNDYPDRVNTVNMADFFTFPETDSIMMNFQSPGAPYFVVGPMPIAITDIFDEVKYATREKPILAVSHKVSNSDTAWIIDHKVKFFQDTVYDKIFIDTYMLADIQARIYPTNTPVDVDLTLPTSADLIRNPGDESQWDRDVLSTDSSKTLATAGSDYYYKNVFMDKFDSTGTWGYKLGNYWPFNGEFYNGDIIGTKDTPIRHYIKKPEAGTIISGSDVRFMSIVWRLDESTGSMVHVNSYISSSTFKLP